MKNLMELFRTKPQVINLDVLNHREARIKMLDLIRSNKVGIYRITYYSDVVTINSFDRTITSKSLSMVLLVQTVMIGLKSDYKVSQVK